MTEETKTTTKKEKIGVIALVAILIIGYCAYRLVDFDEILNPPPDELAPAELELYSFEDLVEPGQVNVEIMIINLGEETAKNINVFVRAKNQTGNILFEGNITLTCLILRADEMTSGAYTISLIGNDDIDIASKTNKIKHTIEISWSSGRKTYTKETKI